MLSAALNVERMAAPLGPLLLPTSCAGRTPTITRARLLDLKPGNRGLIRYEVSEPESGDRWTVFGKLYAEPVQAARVHQAMKWLWAEVFTGEAYGVPQPLGCLLELPMLLYIPVKGRPLDERTPAEQLLDCMNLGGAWLATLHQHRPALDRQFLLTTELVNLSAWAALVGQMYSDEAKAATQLCRYLQERADELWFEAHAPLHKDFHYGHLVVNGRLDVIDFDEMRLGDPNFDLAHFCANLHLLAYRMRNSPWTYATLQSAFLGAYAGRTVWIPDDRFVYFFVYTCLKIAWQLCTGYGPYPRPQGHEQHQQVRLILDQGLAALSRGPLEAAPGIFVAPTSLERSA
jgi:hypothetical protein